MSDPSIYTVGWVCATATEYIAARVILDEQHGGPESVPIHDSNDHTLGKIGQQNIVIACLPDGEYGSNPTGKCVSNMIRSFQNLKVGLLVGIGRGAPSLQHDVRLGDVTVSATETGRSGVVQYDNVKTLQHERLATTGVLNRVGICSSRIDEHQKINFQF